MEEEEAAWAWVCEGVVVFVLVLVLGVEGEGVIMVFVGRRGVRERVMAWILRRRDGRERVSRVLFFHIRRGEPCGVIFIYLYIFIYIYAPMKRPCQHQVIVRGQLQ